MLLRTAVLLGLGLFAIACGTTVYEEEEPSGTSRSSTASQEVSCRCTVKVNKEEKTFDCGDTVCVGKQSWTCEGEPIPYPERRGNACDDEKKGAPSEPGFDFSDGPS